MSLGREKGRGGFRGGWGREMEEAKGKIEFDCLIYLTCNNNYKNI